LPRVREPCRHCFKRARPYWGHCFRQPENSGLVLDQLDRTGDVVLTIRGPRQACFVESNTLTRSFLHQPADVGDALSSTHRAWEACCGEPEHADGLFAGRTGTLGDVVLGQARQRRACFTVNDSALGTLFSVNPSAGGGVRAQPSLWNALFAGSRATNRGGG